jgi:hypothetical protein
MTENDERRGLEREQMEGAKTIYCTGACKDERNEQQ